VFNRMERRERKEKRLKVFTLGSLCYLWLIIKFKKGSTNG